MMLLTCITHRAIKVAAYRLIPLATFSPHALWTVRVLHMGYFPVGCKRAPTRTLVFGGGHGPSQPQRGPTAMCHLGLLAAG